MSGATHTHSPASPSGAMLATTLGACLLGGAAVTAVATRAPLPGPSMLLAGGLGLIFLLALAIARYDLAVGLGLVTLGVVKVEPAPPDLIFAVVIAVALVTGRMSTARVPLAAVGSVAVFISLNVLSAIDLIDPTRAAFYFSITLYLAVFALWFADYLNSVARASLLVHIYLAVAVVSAIVSVAAFSFSFPLSAEFLDKADTRAAGLFKDPNVFGPFLIPILLITIEETLNPRLLRLSMFVKLLCSFILSAGVVFSFSRAAWFSLVLGIVVMAGVIALRRGGAKRVLAISAIATTAVLAVFAVLLATGSVDFLEERSTVQSYDSNRFEAQSLGIELAEENPLGRGPGQFDVIAPIAAHSTYVRVVAEQGLLGILALTAIFVATLAYALRNAGIGRSTYGIGSAALLGAWLGLLVNSLVVDTLHWRHLWLVAALIWAGTMRSGAERAQKPSPALPG